MAKRSLHPILQLKKERPQVQHLSPEPTVRDEDMNEELADFNRFARVVDQHTIYGDVKNPIDLAFELFDKDRDGYISTDELRQGMDGMGRFLSDQEIGDRMIEFNKAGDGLLHPAEFEDLMLVEVALRRSKARGPRRTQQQDDDVE